MSADDLRQKANHFRDLASGECDPGLRSDLRVLASEYDAAAADMDRAGPVKWAAAITLPNC